MNLTQTQKISLGKKEITKRIRQQLKQDFKNCTFSTTMERYSGGSSITISLMKSDFKIIQDYDKLDFDEIRLDILRYTQEQIKQMQEEKYRQLNQYTTQEAYNPHKWNNGVFLTKKGHELMAKVVQIVNQYNYDNSDLQSDYFDVNFYLHLELGKHDKPFIDGVKQ